MRPVCLPPPPPPPAATAANDVEEEDDAEEEPRAKAKKVEERSLWEWVVDQMKVWK